jgi:hypothetical protein
VLLVRSGLGRDQWGTNIINDVNEIQTPNFFMSYSPFSQNTKNMRILIHYAVSFVLFCLGLGWFRISKGFSTSSFS